MFQSFSEDLALLWPFPIVCDVTEDCRDGVRDTETEPLVHWTQTEDLYLHAFSDFADICISLSQTSCVMFHGAAKLSKLSPRRFIHLAGSQREK